MGPSRSASSGPWRAEVGTVAMPQGLRRLRVGGVLPLSGSRLSGTPASPTGPVDLVLDLDGSGRPVPHTGSPRPRLGRTALRVEDRPRRKPRPRDPILVPVKENRTMSQPTAPARHRPRHLRSTSPSR